MKILAASDIHGDTRLVQKLAQQASDENVDLVVLCGDLTQAEQSTDNLIGPFAKLGKKVLLIPGNHETVATTDFLAQVYGVTNLHGYSIQIGDVGIFGCGGADIGPFPTEDKEIYELLLKGHEKIKNAKKRIMVTHAHPMGAKMERFSDFVHGSEAVKKAIEKLKPDIMFCGHVHEAQGIEEKMGDTIVMNVGKHGKIIDV